MLVTQAGIPYRGIGLNVRTNEGDFKIIAGMEGETYAFDGMIHASEVPDLLRDIRRAMVRVEFLPDEWAGAAATILEILSVTPQDLKRLLSILSKSEEGIDAAARKYTELVRALGEQAMKMPFRNVIAHKIAQGVPFREIMTAFEKMNMKHLTGFGGEHGGRYLARHEIIVIDLTEKKVSGYLSRENIMKAIELLQKQLALMEVTS